MCIRDSDRYVEAARFAGITGKDDHEVFENFIKALEDLKEKIGIKKSIAEYGISEKDFMETLDVMVEQAFDDPVSYTHLDVYKRQFIISYSMAGFIKQ